MSENKWDEMRSAFREAERQVSAADVVVNDMASMICGRLRKVSVARLQKIKKELRLFNAHTGRWDAGK